MTISIKLPKNLEYRLACLAKKTRRSKAYYIHEMIKNHIDEIEDYYLTSDIIKRTHQGKEAIFSSQEVRKELDLND